MGEETFQCQHNYACIIIILIHRPELTPFSEPLFRLLVMRVDFLHYVHVYNFFMNNIY